MLCTLASFWTFSAHSSTSLRPSGVRVTPRGGEDVSRSMMGVELSRSEKSGQCGRFAKRRMRQGRSG